MTSPANSIPDSQLGLTGAEIQTLRQQQAIALSQAGASSSRAASNASSQGRLLLDPSSLAQLSAHFDRLLHAITSRWHYLNAQAAQFTNMQHDRAGTLIGNADAEIARFHEIIRQTNELQVEFDKIRRIGEIVKGFRARVEALDRRI
ncbi:hypothetical protein EJ05DRAFT_209783 [Pseudovirgaria hyperparasitica]|uniref:Biogenesis of lysosome-related organelles complex 1 subunit CNL1 n=1 Tax=Pseudovirgaria hyperparasitica TaxID=470096 RepID=A0A6A6VU14_9PEZI|nr:uncharacterized protein EJ05DRAFT_209783 [Pseudovirgaria hyperparasitica]KAF2753286.1 hypothetical protein EJ05DRAFT_209783 [Pseudovirgaria hyperparasitica]